MASTFKARASAAIGGLLRTAPGPSWWEVLVAGVFLACVGVIVYGPHVLHGGFYSDDWGNAAGYKFAHPPRYWNNVVGFEHELGGRPVLALLLPLPHALFGVHPGPQIGLALALGVATSLCFYVLLRSLSIAPLEAGAIGVLVLLFPWADSIRLWPTASLNTLAVCFFLLGLVLALRGLAHGGRRSLAMHAGAVVLYLLSVLTYEVAAGAILLSGFLYLGRAPRRTALRLWAVDVVLVLVALTYSLATTTGARHVGSLSQRVSDVPTFVRQSVSLLGRALVPLGSPGVAVKATALLLASAVIAAALFRLRRAPDPRLWFWTIAIGVAAVGIGAAYFILLGSYLHPLDQGTANRGNLFAALGFGALVYALIAAGARWLVGRAELAAALSLAVAALVAAGYGARVRDDEAHWRQASDLQRQALDVVDRQLPRLPRHSGLLTFGYPANAAPGVPVFSESWDLVGAVQIEADDPTLRAYPVYEGVAVRCTTDRVLVHGPGSYGEARLRYGNLFFLDVGNGRHRRIASPAGCRAAWRGFRPGPLLPRSST
jgi:hypothetical protein